MTAKINLKIRIFHKLRTMKYHQGRIIEISNILINFTFKKIFKMRGLHRKKIQKVLHPLNFEVLK
jgi:hypothetical protein